MLRFRAKDTPERSRAAQLWTAAIAAVFAIAPAAHGELMWDEKKISKTAEVGDHEAQAEFSFTNTGDEPVTIRSARPSNFQMRMESDKETFEPDESSTLKVTLPFGKRKGILRETVTVTTDDPDAEPVTLTLEVTVPVLVRMVPQQLAWAIDEPREPKSIELRVVYEEPIEITHVTTDGDLFDAELVEIDEGREYRIDVAPVRGLDGEVRKRAAELGKDAQGRPFFVTQKFTIHSNFPEEHPERWTFGVRASVPSQPPVVSDGAVGEAATDDADAQAQDAADGDDQQSSDGSAGDDSQADQADESAEAADESSGESP